MKAFSALKLTSLFLHAVAVLALPLAEARAVDAPVSLEAAMEAKGVSVQASGNGRDQLTLTFHNDSATPLNVSLPAGRIAQGIEKPDRVVLLRKAVASIAPRSVAEVTLPVAALSSTPGGKTQPFLFTAISEPRLQPLLDYLANQPDAPRSTVQVAVLCLLENLNYAQWLQLLAGASSGAPANDPHPTPAEVTQAVDILGILRQIAPTQNFALAGDSELKLRALRNPWCRAKAMQVYGLNLGDGAVPPDLGQLLHTKPGDNCPICRQRALLEKGSSDL